MYKIYKCVTWQYSVNFNPTKLKIHIKLVANPISQSGENGFIGITHSIHTYICPLIFVFFFVFPFLSQTPFSLLRLLHRNGREIVWYKALCQIKGTTKRLGHTFFFSNPKTFAYIFPTSRKWTRELQNMRGLSFPAMFNIFSNPLCINRCTKQATFGETHRIESIFTFPSIWEWLPGKPIFLTKHVTALLIVNF